MKGLSIFMFGAFGTMAVIDLFSGEFQVGLLELLVAVHSLSDYFEYKTKELK
jgi:hypothetical protein